MLASLALAAATVLWADEPRSDLPLAERVASLRKQAEDLEKEFDVRLRAAKHDDAKVGEANDWYRQEHGKVPKALMDLVKAHPADPAALDGVLALVETCRYFLDDRITAIVLEHHADRPEMGRLCFAIAYRGGEDWPERIAEHVAAKHPDPAVRGQAIYALGDMRYNQATPWGREWPAEQKATLLEQAGQFFRQASAEYTDVPTPDGKTTLGKAAGHELARLRNLPNLKAGRPAPPIEGTDLDGKPMSLADHKGKVVLVVFWGSWCGPCMAMVPHERELAERHCDRPFVLLGVNCGDTLDLARATAKEKGMTWPSWWDGEEIRGPIETEYDVPHWPTTVVIGADGIIRAWDARGEELDQAIAKALDDAELPAR